MRLAGLEPDGIQILAWFGRGSNPPPKTAAD
jgi:hypothetical protein